MAENFYIKPSREGLIVRDPITCEPLPATGDWKPRNKYWLRRRTEGSVVECETAEAFGSKERGGREAGRIRR